jgi:hypothetical protein
MSAPFVDALFAEANGSVRCRCHACRGFWDEEFAVMAHVRNVFETILKYGHDEDFAPVAGRGFTATDAPAGSREKIDVLARRIQEGQPLWHPEDRRDYTGLTGVVRPRD